MGEDHTTADTTKANAGQARQTPAKKVHRRRFLKIAAAIGALVTIPTCRPMLHLAQTALNDTDMRAPLPDTMVDDASQLNRTQVAQIWHIPDRAELAEDQMVQLLQDARTQKLHIAIAGARHTMGGHTIYPDGIALDMRAFKQHLLNEQTDRLWVQAGARWADIIPYLNEHGRSIAVMQSNNSFTVGGSVNANAHGWQHNHPPLASTVESCRVMLASGQIVPCSRTENRELFRLVVGGYGLFGVILDLQLRIVPNARYRLSSWVLPSAQYLEFYDRHVNQRKDAAMVFGRFDVSAPNFLHEASLNVFYHDDGGTIPALTETGYKDIMRTLFRGSVGSEYGKQLRWNAEKAAFTANAGKIVSRNQLLHEGVEYFQNRSADSTDILHEYFVPLPNLDAFLERLRIIIPQHQGDLLNVTIRHVVADTDSLLRYADQEVFGLVMLFNQKRTQAAEQQMQHMTRDIIDAILELGGRYYLPYRLHATAEQLHHAYPQARQFFALKRHYDPEERFQNQFYQLYGQT